MTPKEKAEELMYSYTKTMLQKKFHINGLVIEDLCKQCSLKTVDMILESDPLSPFNGDYYETMKDRVEEAKNFWKQVKQEIEKL